MPSKKWTRKKWTVNELDAFNIRINTVDTKAFFGFSDLPAPAISPQSIILNHDNRPDGLELSNDDNRFFLFLLHPTISKGHDFAGQVLTMMGFELLHGLIMSQRLPLPFIMNDRWLTATPTFLLRDREEYIHLFVETETLPQDRVEPRLVASAMGAFTSDNAVCTHAGLPPLPSKRYIGVVMIKSAPRLYKITITQTLLSAVETSQTPAEETIVERFIPPVPNLDAFFDEGMIPLENRRICLQCFEALKALI